METQILIKSEHGHYVAYVNGKRFCSGDTYGECVDTLADNGIYIYGHPIKSVTALCSSVVNTKEANT